MTTSISLGRAASCLQRSAASLCLAFIAGAALFAGGAQAQEAPAAVVAPAPRAPGDGPPLWVIRDADSTLYLFGTIHMLKPGTTWGSDKVDAAFDGASEVWFEVVNPDDQAAMMTAIRQYGVSQEGPLSDRLTAGERTELDHALGGAGLSLAQVDPMRPWFAAMMIGVSPLTQAGFDPMAGVELNLRARALAAGKTIRGFETVDQQIAGLAAMSSDGQMAYLRHYMTSSGQAAAELERTIAGWVAGDLRALEAFAWANGRAISEETHQLFMARRNADWANQIETLLRGSGTAFIAVGGAHLVGDDSVQGLLAARGITTTRL